MTKQELEQKLEQLQKQLDELKNVKMKTKLKEIKVGEQFEFGGNKYTKLNIDGYCILDEYREDIPDWAKFMPFDAKNDYSNNFEQSTIKEYIKSDYFKYDVLYLENNTDITLLSIEEIDEYKNLLKPFFEYFWSRSASYSNSYHAYYVTPSGASYGNFNVNRSIAVRPALHLNLNSIVSCTTPKNKEIEELKK